MTGQHIIIPEGVDPEVVQRLVTQEANRVRHEQRQRDYYQSVLTSEEGWTKFVAKAAKDGCKIVRASVYAKLRIRSYQEVLPEEYCDDPRRPVILRGSRPCMIARYARSSYRCANGWCEAVATRYFKITKWTSFDFEKNNKAIRDLYHKLCKKHSPSHHFKLSEYYLSRDGTEAWIRGTHYSFSDRRYQDYVKRNLDSLSKHDIEDISRAPTWATSQNPWDKALKESEVASASELARRMFAKRKPTPEQEAELEARRLETQKERVRAEDWGKRIQNDWRQRHAPKGAPETIPTVH